VSTLALDSAAAEFPVLEREGLVYLDSAATSQKPRPVIDAMAEFMRHHNASVHRGVYPLAVESTERFEGARERLARFLGSSARETVFTGNATAR
jgi:cysteine desulfurase/selenocysteine lyase